MSSFVHLHVHSHYSLLDGLNQIEDLVDFAVRDNAPAIALTDHGVMYGAIEFYQTCLKAGIKPIIGLEAYVAYGSRLDKAGGGRSGEKNYHHLILLAQNYHGYKNLLKLCTIGHLEGFYYKPRLDWEILQKYHHGLIALSGCMAGEIPRLLLSGQAARAKERVWQYQQLFGPDNYYLEIQHHPELEGNDLLKERLIALSQELAAPLVATNDAHYAEPADAEAQDILLCLQNKTKKDEPSRLSMINGNYALRSSREMQEIFAETPQAIANTLKIVQNCQLEIPLGQIQLPYFIVPEGFDGNGYLRHLALEGAPQRYGKTYEQLDEVYRTRFDYELEVIKKMGWPSYFLIVADFVNWAKKQKIVVGPGRGSAAGSLISYLIGITNLCPIKYELLFERFLNPDRVSMPDIDLDFADTRRDEVIRYVQDKYGHDKVAQIITFGTMAARAAIRDVGRVLDYPYDYCDKLAKMVPMLTKLSKALQTVPELKEVYRQESGAKEIVDYALKLEGVARHASTHACGVVITAESLTEYVPLQRASSSDQSIVSQYSLHPIEDLGLLKMDFLGLKNLTIIESAVKIIKNTRGLEIDIDNLPLNDKKTFQLFAAGNTVGVFQFESSGMQRYLRELQPTGFEDIIAMVSLYRPGPMEWIPDYIAGKHGKKKPKYLHPKLEPILKTTYGVAIYQEQVMRMARDLAGFTMGEADVLRKAVGKKIPKLLAEQKIKFIEGGVKNGLPSELGEKIFSFIEPFAGYGFNRSHGACYAMVAYQTAYLKANFPTEFMAALLTSDQQDSDRVVIEIGECRRLGIEVKQPDLNQSFESFTVITSGTAQNQSAVQGEEPRLIRFGLNAVKNVGEHIAEAIIIERKNRGPYQDISDFLERVSDKDLNKKSLESLIKCGALDNLGDRQALLHNLENLLEFHRTVNQARQTDQISLFSDTPQFDLGPKIKLRPGKAASDIWEKLNWERELLGLYVSDHPFNAFREMLNKQITALKDLPEKLESASAPSFTKATANKKTAAGMPETVVAGVITDLKSILTRKNERMLFAKIEDGSAKAELVIFPRVLQNTAGLWQAGAVIAASGAVSDKDNEIKILVNAATALSHSDPLVQLQQFKQSLLKQHRNGFNNQQPPAPPVVQPLKLVIAVADFTLERQTALKDLLLEHPGSDQALIKIIQDDRHKIIETSFGVNNGPALQTALRQLGNWLTVKI